MTRVIYETVNLKIKDTHTHTHIWVLLPLTLSTHSDQTCTHTKLQNTHCLHSRTLREVNADAQLAGLLPYIGSRTSAHSTLPATFRVDLSSANPL